LWFDDHQERLNKGQKAIGVHYAEKTNKFYVGDVPVVMPQASTQSYPTAPRTPANSNTAPRQRRARQLKFAFT
jgi:hypothetical protein